MKEKGSMLPVIQFTKPHQEFSGTAPLKIIHDQDEIEKRYSTYLFDESRISGAQIESLIFAYSEKQVVETLKKSYKTKTPVTISAARTGIVGGAVPLEGNLLSLEKMNRYLGARWDETHNCWCVRVEPGLSLDELKDILDNKQFQEPLSRLQGEAKGTLQKFALESDQWYYPVDPTEKTAHIGGTVATNASGARTFKYGPTRVYVTGLRVALADGTLLSIQRGEVKDMAGKGFQIDGINGSLKIPFPDYSMVPVKNTAGYYHKRPMDLIDYFIGSEGTLGVITEVELMLVRKQEMKLGVVAYFKTEADAIQFVKKVREKRKDADSLIDSSAIEYFDSHSLDLLRKKRDGDGPESPIPPFSDAAQAAIYFEQDGKEEDLNDFSTAYDRLLSACNSSMEDTWGAINAKSIRRMNIFRHAIPEAVNSLIGQRQKDFPGLHKVSTDFAVPDASLEKMMGIYKTHLEEEGFDHVIFGHIGENHLHVNILPKNENELKKAKVLYLKFAKEAVALGGTVSGEHGIGKIKKNMLAILYSEEAIQEMKKVKMAMDPLGLLNRGNLWD